MSSIAIPYLDTRGQSSFENIPPFPNTVPTAPLLRISLSKLVAGDEEEEGRVWDASCKLGFFYLDLRSLESSTQSVGRSDENTNDDVGVAKKVDEKMNSDCTGLQNGDGVLDGDALLKDADGLFKVGEEFFNLPKEEKRKYDFKDQGSYFGYKGFGDGFIDKEGNRDRNEFYNASYFPSFLSLYQPFH